MIEGSRREQDPQAAQPHLGPSMQSGPRKQHFQRRDVKNSFVSVGFYDGSRDIRTSLRTRLPGALKEELATFEPRCLVKAAGTHAMV